MITQYDLISRDGILGEAVDKCMIDLYNVATPAISWEDFKRECRKYNNEYRQWEAIQKYYLNREEEPEKWKMAQEIYPNWDPDYKIYVGPRPYEFYYVPQEIQKDIVEHYVYIYKLDHKQELLDTIDILKKYCEEPIVDKYVEGDLREDGTRWPGYRGYTRPDNLIKQLINLIPDSGFDKSVIAESVYNKFFEFLDMAGKFFNWNRDLNNFYTSVYLGVSPNSNKETVIANWKEYRNQDIEIDEEQIKKDYYADDECD